MSETLYPRVSVRVSGDDLNMLASRARRHGRFHGGRPNVSAEVTRAIAWYAATCPDFFELGQQVEVDSREDGSLSVRVFELTAALAG